jgi:pyrimidine-nucleoside phosphorylase
MLYIGNSHKKETMAIITNMDRPLGYMVGNALEVKEAMDILNNKGNRDLRELCVVISTYMVSMSKGISFAEASKEVLETIRTGKAYNKFLEMIIDIKSES